MRRGRGRRRNRREGQPRETAEVELDATTTTSSSSSGVGGGVGGICAVGDGEGHIPTSSSSPVVAEDITSPTHLFDLVFDAAWPHLTMMMTDPFGNYLFQKLVEHSFPEQRLRLVEAVAPVLVAAALNLHGTRSVQRMVEVCTEPEEVEIIVRELEKRTCDLCRDTNGNHVIQRCLNCMSPRNSVFVYRALSRQCLYIGRDRHGCCVIQRSVDSISNEEQRGLVFQAMIRNARNLVEDPYGVSVKKKKKRKRKRKRKIASKYTLC